MSCAQREHLWYEDHRPVVALSAADLFVNEFRDSDFMQRRATLQEKPGPPTSGPDAPSSSIQVNTDG